MGHILKRALMLGSTMVSVAAITASGVVAAEASSSWAAGWTGAGSQNQSANHYMQDFNKHNNNLVRADSQNRQHAASGSAGVGGNTIADYGLEGNYSHGSGGTGNASNSAHNSANVSVSNNNLAYLFSMLGSGGGSSIGVTGPGSYNYVTNYFSNSFTTTNTNFVNVANGNEQMAHTGDSMTSGNTVASGGGSSGGATNHANNGSLVSIGNNTGGGASMTAFGSGGVTSGNIWLTGPGSNNMVTNTVSNSYAVTNNNMVTLANYNGQSAASGGNSTAMNTVALGGGGGTGSASNTAANNAAVTVSNSSSASAAAQGQSHDVPANGQAASSIGLTGPGSHNSVSNTFKNSVDQTNTNYVGVQNMNDQMAKTGDSLSAWNTVAGGAGATGDAANTADNAAHVMLTN